MSRIRRTGYKKSEVSRSQVLDAAIAVLAKKGIAGTSVQDIADGAGLSKGSVHYHFESKEELFARVLDRCCEVVEARIRGVFEAEGPPIERIRRAFAEMWRLRRDGAREMRVLTELHLLARQNRRVRKAFAEALQRSRQQMIETGLEYLAAMGLRPKVPVDIIPRIIMATLDGLALQHEIEPISAETEGQLIGALEALTLAFFEH
ncbi:MAG TPA: TetR/AcrR family transcriptional regulator [Labilithrix sp.]|jgi:AcrR family transcriptional regulator|nr:TetR/AcrR family transcriptional regulator [Labilithrix sp.]